MELIGLLWVGIVIGRHKKPYSGKLLLRIPSELHASIATAAEVNGKSINQWITQTLSQASRD